MVTTRCAGMAAEIVCDGGSGPAEEKNNSGDVKTVEKASDEWRSGAGVGQGFGGFWGSGSSGYMLVANMEL